MKRQAKWWLKNSGWRMTWDSQSIRCWWPASEDASALRHALESAPEFVVIDNVELAEGAEGGNLVVTLELSTYYRNAAVS